MSFEHSRFLVEQGERDAVRLLFQSRVTRQLHVPGSFDAGDSVHRYHGRLLEVAAVEHSGLADALCRRYADVRVLELQHARIARRPLAVRAPVSFIVQKCSRRCHCEIKLKMNEKRLTRTVAEEETEIVR